MKCSKITFLTLLLIALFSLTFQAQIPNGGFENWSLGDPDLWHTNNVVSLKPITQSVDAYTGNSSVRLEILNNGGIPFGPMMYPDPDNNAKGFPCSQRYATLSGYFKYSPRPNTIFHFTVGMHQGGNLIGVASSDITTSTSDWTPFNIPIVYFAPGDPDTCQFQMNLTSTTDTGAVAYLDELTLMGATGISELSQGQIPTRFELKQNYPNPFNPSTNIEFSIPQSGDVKLVAYNQLGQTVAILVNERLSASSYSVNWNAEGLPSGIYFYRITSDNFAESRKMVLMK